MPTISNTESQGAMRTMLRQDKASYRTAVTQYFSHWDVNQHDAEHETDEARQMRTHDSTGLTQQYYHLTTYIFEHAWGESFHFCRFARGENFARAIARHEHYLAASIGIKGDMRVLDVGCGVGGPAREIVKFTGCHVTGLNISKNQIEHANAYAERDGLSHKVDFVRGDFMVSQSSLFSEVITLITSAAEHAVSRCFI